MSNGIKVGDKVRVREDAPKLIFGDCDMSQFVCTVCCVDKDIAAINVINDESSELKVWIVPTKYLVKVDAEAKEAKYRKGDRIKFKNIYELQKVKDKSFRWMLLMFASKEATITEVEDNGFYRVDIDPSIGGINDDMIECKIEPTERTEAEKKPNIGSIKIPVEVDLTDSFWDAYTADLAKEIAVRVANKYNDPEQAVEYAVKVAKAVAEGLKKK